MRSHEERTQHEHQVIHDRISRVSSESVQQDVHAQMEKDRDKEITALTNRISAVESRPGITLGKAVMLAMMVIAFIGLLLQAYSTAKGAK